MNGVVDVGQHDRAQLVLDRAVVHTGPVREVGNGECEAGGLHTQLVTQAPRDGAAERLAELRVSTTGVGPHPWPRPLSFGALREQHGSVRADGVAGEREVQRGGAIVRFVLRHQPGRDPSRIDNDDVLLLHAETVYKIEVSSTTCPRFPRI